MPPGFHFFIPEGCSKVAQCFSFGFESRRHRSPEGTAENALQRGSANCEGSELLTWRLGGGRARKNNDPKIPPHPGPLPQPSRGRYGSAGRERENPRLSHHES